MAGDPDDAPGHPDPGTPGPDDNCCQAQAMTVVAILAMPLALPSVDHEIHIIPPPLSNGLLIVAPLLNPPQLV